MVNYTTVNCTLVSGTTTTNYQNVSTDIANNFPIKYVYNVTNGIPGTYNRPLTGANIAGWRLIGISIPAGCYFITSRSGSDNAFTATNIIHWTGQTWICPNSSLAQVSGPYNPRFIASTSDTAPGTATSGAHLWFVANAPYNDDYYGSGQGITFTSLN